MRQGFPRWKLEQFEMVDQVAKCSRDIFCFTTRSDHHELHAAELFFGAKFGQK
jgi:hypothetical protein